MNKFHKKNIQKFFFKHPCMHAKEIKNPWTKLDGDLILELKFDQFIAFLSLDPFCIQERNGNP